MPCDVWVLVVFVLPFGFDLPLRFVVCYVIDLIWACVNFVCLSTLWVLLVLIATLNLVFC